MRLMNIFLAAAFSISLAACGGGSSSTPSPTSSSAVSFVRSLAASSVAEVFSFRALTPNDLSQVTTAWAQRDLTAKNVRIAYEYSEVDYNVKIYEHTIGAN
ncbi:MAG: hypothetical protein K5Q00_07830, partial [Gammaproteobacteria bacterium]|nr:hypothetical protein [Gammaproteobacteria bacterium]